LAAMQATCNGEDPVLLVLPADHLIQDQRAFEAAIGTARILAGRKSRRLRQGINRRTHPGRLGLRSLFAVQGRSLSAVAWIR
jgi:mannose-1-phosphate guanylyltransferase